MSNGILSAIASAAVYSVSNYIDKFLLEKQKLNYYVITVYSGIFGLLAGLIIAFFAGVYTDDFKTIILIIISGFFINISLLPYYKALSKDETSRIVPLFQSIPVFVLILGYIFLGEELTMKQYLGATLIILASFIISMKEPGYKIFRLRPSLWLMLLSCFLYAVGIICFKFGLKEIPFFQSLTYEGIGLMLCSLTILIVGKKWPLFIKQSKKMKRAVYLYISINEFVYLLSRYFSWFSLTLINAGLASILIQGIQPFITLSYGTILTLFFPKVLKESLDRKNFLAKIICSLIMFVGLYLILF